ncbi:hypothetical protein D3C77_533430 [compost metagenome]
MDAPAVIFSMAVSIFIVVSVPSSFEKTQGSHAFEQMGNDIWLDCSSMSNTGASPAAAAFVFWPCFARAAPGQYLVR